jgi:two-component system, LytTR family, sensor kinase
MEKRRFFFTKGSWLQINLRWGLLLGVCVGLILSLFRSALSLRLISLRAFAFNVLFSVTISLCICNMTWLSQRLWKLQTNRFWQFIVIYYASCILGMIMGVEISYFIISLIFDDTYVFLGHPADLISSCFIVLVVCTIIYTNQAQRERLNAQIKAKELDVVKLQQLKTQAELQALQSRINPHFLYNALNSIAGLIHEDPDRAEDMTLKLSKLFRYSINSQNENLATVADEMEIVSTYLDIERVRFGERIRFTISVDDECRSRQIPRFLIQPLVENAFKHGLNNRARDGELKVNVDIRDGKTCIEVGDNGAPFPEQLSAGYGLQSTYDKLDLLFPGAYEVQFFNEPEKMVRILLGEMRPAAATRNDAKSTCKFQ